MNFFITDPDGERHPADRARRLRRRLDPRGADPRADADREEDHRLSRHRRHLGQPAAAAAAEERGRARPGARGRPGTRSPSSRSASRTAPSSTTTTRWRSSRAPEPRWPRQPKPGGYAPPALGDRLRRAWRRNRAGYLFLLPWFIGFFGLTLGPTLASLYLSFTDYDLLTPPRWAGLKNYT